MQATFTLSTTSFLSKVLVSDSQVNLASTSGIVPGVFLFANRELLQVVGLTGVGNYATVLRGRDGTETRTHGTGETIYLAQGYQLFQSDPQGLPSKGNVLVNPHINVANGIAWVIQGDDEGPGADARQWVPVTTTQIGGALGVRVTTVTTPT